MVRIDHRDASIDCMHEGLDSSASLAHNSHAHRQTAIAEAGSVFMLSLMKLRHMITIEKDPLTNDHERSVRDQHTVQRTTFLRSFEVQMSSMP